MSAEVEIILAVASLVAAAAAAAAAWFSLVVSRRVFEFHRRRVGPDVVVYARQDPRSSTIIQLVIENVGGDHAYDITFDLSSTLPHRAWGFPGHVTEEAEPMTVGPLVHGIPALAKGDRRIMDWGQYGGLHKFLGDGFVRVTAKYSDADRNDLSRLSLLEVKSFSFCDASERGPLVKINSTLEEIGRALKRVIDGENTLLVESPVKYRARREEMRRKLEAKRANNA